MSNDIHTFGQATRDILKEQRGLFKGYGSTITSLVPFITIMQIRGTPYKNGLQAFFKIVKQEGFLKLFQTTVLDF